MKKIFIIVCVLSGFTHASFMDKVSGIVKNTLSDSKSHKFKHAEIQTVGTLSVQDGGSKKKVHPSLLDKMVHKVEDTIGIKDKKNKKGKKESSLFSNVVDKMKKTVGMEPKKKKKKSKFSSIVSKVKKTIGIKEKKKKDDTFSLTSTMNGVYGTIGLDKGENWGLPSVLGLNKKQKKKSFFNSGILGSVTGTGTGIYNGLKHSGQSAEFASGMMYKSTKVYNGMFDMFDGSPLNVFKDEEEESSIFDIFDKGNSLLDMLD